MKKVICIILTTVMCLSLCGCSQLIGRLPFAQYRPVSKGEQRRVQKHLEEKYGEKFVIDGTFTPDNSGALSRGVYVYPAGREDERSFVVITPLGEFVDYYVLHIPEEQMQTIYEEWIQSVIPSAKITIRLSMSLAKEVTYYPEEETLQDFISRVNPSIDITIVLQEQMLDKKDELFETLSQLPDSEPLRDFNSVQYFIAFYAQEAYEQAISGEYMEMFAYPIGEPYVTASTGLAYSENEPVTWPFTEQIYDNFETKEDEP